MARRQLKLGLSHYTRQDLCSGSRCWDAAPHPGSRPSPASPAMSRLNSPAPPPRPCRSSALSRNSPALEGGAGGPHHLNPSTNPPSARHPGLHRRRSGKHNHERVLEDRHGRGHPFPRRPASSPKRWRCFRVTQRLPSLGVALARMSTDRPWGSSAYRHRYQRSTWSPGRLQAAAGRLLLNSKWGAAEEFVRSDKAVGLPDLVQMMQVGFRGLPGAWAR